MLVACALLVILVPAVLTLSAPTLASVSGPADPVPPIPSAAAGAPGNLDGQIAPLPMVVSGLPDPASQTAAADYAHLDVMEPSQALQMFQDAWAGLTVPLGDLTVAQFGDFLLSYSDTSATDPTQFNAQAAAAFPILTADDANADRLTNSAVALWLLGLGQVEGAPASSQLDPPTLQRNALRLLAATYRSFPEHRATVLDMAYFDTLIVALEELGSWPQPVDVLRTWISGSTTGPLCSVVACPPHAGDLTARHLLASVISRFPYDLASGSDYGAAMAAVRDTLSPLTGQPATSALGLSALGDAYLAIAANQKQSDQLGSARQSAWSALNEYDSALQLNTDPGLYAGRAAALDFLGHPAEALTAIDLALSRRPDSAELLLRKADLQEETRDLLGMRTSARSAERIVFANWRPEAVKSRFVFTADPAGRLESFGIGVPQDRGYLGYSYGSDRLHITVWDLLLQTAGGGFGLSYDVLPQSPDPQFDARRLNGILADQAALTAIQAGIGLAIPSAADQDAAAWQQAMLDPHIAGNPLEPAGKDFTWQTGRQSAVIAAQEAAHLLPPEQLPSGDLGIALKFGQTSLRRVGEYAGAAQLCAHVAGGSSGQVQESAYRCQGESEFLAGDFSGAGARLSQAYKLSLDAQGQPTATSVELLAEQAATAARLGQFSEATRLFSSIDPGCPDCSDGVVATEKLAELALDTGAIPLAVRRFRAAVAAYHGATDLGAQTARSDLGIALLRGAQAHPNERPDCTAHRADCLSARDAFAAAGAMDPGNGVYLMNLGWAQRLLGDGSGARKSLQQAVNLDSTLYPALNDLGILTAQAGDPGAARADFEQAIRASPTYELAAWNLGVLEMNSGVLGVPRGEAFLARSFKLQPQLRMEGLEFHTDERIYRTQLGGGTLGSFNQSYSVAVAVVGFAGLLTLLLRVFWEFGQGKGLDFLGEHLARLGRAETGLARVLGRLSRGESVPAGLRPIWPWLLTMPALALITIWNAVAATRDARPTTVLMALLAVAVGVVAHEAGHLIAGRRLKLAVAPSPTLLGLLLAAVLIPLHATGGPYLGHQVPVGEPRKRQLVYLAGPGANLLVLLIAAAAFLAVPLPLLLTIVVAQLGIISFSLLPFPPMDGAVLSEEHPRAVAITLLVLIVLGALLTEGVI